ncbi:heparanase-like protein 3 [Tanacetum coccineum]
MGKTVLANGVAVRTWDSTKTKTFLRYTVKKNYSVYGWELGSELGANRIGASILASHYACDTNSLSDILRRIYNSTKSKPLIIAPGFGSIDVGLYFFQNLTWIHTSGTNGIPMVLAFLRYDLGRNSYENRGLEPDKKVIDLGSQNFFLCPKQTTTDARSARNKDDEASEAINVGASYSP